MESRTVRGRKHTLHLIALVVNMVLSVGVGLTFLWLTKPSSSLTSGLLITGVLIAGITVLASLTIGRWWGVPVAVAPFALTIVAPLLAEDAFGGVAWVIYVSLATMTSFAVLGITALVQHVIRKRVEQR